MASCENVKIRRRKVCIGDMNQFITIQRRSITCKSITNIDYDEELENVASVWAAVNTNAGYRSFNQVGVNEGAGAGSRQAFTHKFYIRFSQECIPTSENFILWECDVYRIISVENLDGQNRFLALSAIRKGQPDIKANLA